MSKLWKLVLLTIPCLVVGLGCGSGEAVKYNNDLVAVSKEMEAIGKDFGDQANQHMGNPERLKEVYAAALTRGEVAVQRGKALSPPNTTEGKALHQAFLTYLDTEDQIIRVELEKVARFAGENNRAGIASVLEKVQKREQENVQQLKAAQQSFAKANNLKIQ